MAERLAEESNEVKMSVRAMMVLTLPTLAFSAAATLVPFFVPLFLYDFTNSSTLVGFVIGGEGIFCLLIPLWVGVQSDRIWTQRWGRRRPFMIFAAPFMAAALMLVPFQPGIAPIAVSTFVFFAAYHFYSSPYQSLLPDMTPSGFHGRVQGHQQVMRAGGMILGMLAAPFLFDLWKPLPFVIVGFLIMLVTYVTVARVEEPEPAHLDRDEQPGLLSELVRVVRATWASKAIRRFMFSALLWEGTLAALKPFLLKYFTETLGASLNMSGLILVEVGFVLLIAGLVSGYLADRVGRSLIMRIGIWVYLLGSIVAIFLTSVKWAFISLPLFGLGGSIVMTLPYAILMGLMPKDQAGGFTAMFSMVRGLANVVAPLLAGGAVDIARQYVTGTVYEGREFAAIWAICALMLVLSLFFFKGGGKGEVAKT